MNSTIFNFRFGLYFTLVALILYLLNLAGANYLSSMVRQDLSEKVNWVYSHENETFDFVVLGDCRTNEGVDIAIIEEDLGLNGINISKNGASPASLYLILKLFLENKNKVDLILLQLDPGSLDHRVNGVPFRNHLFIPYIQYEYVQEVIRKKVSGAKFLLWRLFPVAMHAEYNSEFLPVFYRDNDASFDFNKTNGSFISPRREEYDGEIGRKYTAQNLYDGENLEQMSVAPVADKEALYYINKIINLAQENNIELKAFSAPYHQNIRSYSNMKPNQEILENLLSRHHIFYKNFNKIWDSYDDSLFYDDVHLNSKGREKLTKDLSNWLKDV